MQESQNSFHTSFLPSFLIHTSFMWAYKTDSIYWIYTAITNSPLQAHSLSSTVVLILPCHTTHGNRCCSTGENWDRLRCYGWTGGRAPADATACLWKTRWTDNTGPSVFSTRTQELALPEPETWFRRHRWRGIPYSQHNIPLSLQSKSLPGNPNTEERWETWAFKRWAGIYWEGICHLQFLLPLLSWCCAHFYTCAHKNQLLARC